MRRETAKDRAMRELGETMQSLGLPPLDAAPQRQALERIADALEAIARLMALQQAYSGAQAPVLREHLTDAHALAGRIAAVLRT